VYGSGGTGLFPLHIVELEGQQTIQLGTMVDDVEVGRHLEH